MIGLRRGALRGARCLSTNALVAAEQLLNTGAFKDIKFTHSTTLNIRWGDMDSMGHVNNVNFFVYFEQARCQAFDDVGLKIGSQHDMVEGPILAQTQCRYRGPVEFPDTVTVGSLSEQTSDSTWTQKYAVVAHSTGRVVAEGDAEMVWFDYKEGKRKSFSEDAKKRLFG